MRDYSTLEQQFGIAGRLTLRPGPGGLPVAVLQTGGATATVGLNGGQVQQFTLADGRPVLWVSPAARYEAGRSLRGGIPVCWPWFGPHPSDGALPAHGFVRTRPWAVRSSHADDRGVTVTLGLSSDETTLALWPHRFDLSIEVTLGAALAVRLRARNTDDTAWQCGGALHSYFAISAIGAAAVQGVAGCAFIDQLRPDAHNVQAGPITVTAETDRIYLDAPAVTALHDGGWRRTITLESVGSRSTVVWNPWIEKSLRLSDYQPDDYRRMLCIETANAGPDTVTVAPGAEHVLAVTISAGSE